MIKAFPDLDLRSLWRHGSDAGVLSANAHWIFYSSGRAAIHHCARILHPGQVLLPAYHCGVEVEAVIKAGCQPVFYRIRPDLSIDLEDLASRITASTRAVLVIHYYGFAQPLADLIEVCRRKSLLLIEDCAHALFSNDALGNRLGDAGDFAVFSFSKTLPMPNGGALQINHSSCGHPPPGRFNLDPAVIKTLVKSACDFEIQSGTRFAKIAKGIISLYHGFSGESAEFAESEEKEDLSHLLHSPSLDYEKGLSVLSARFLRTGSVSKLIVQRRDNYETLSELFIRRYPHHRVFPSLPQETNPLTFPVAIKNRDAVLARMASKGVSAFVFGRLRHPSLDPAAFPESRRLSAEILALPVHQQLASRDMERIFEVYEEALADR